MPSATVARSSTDPSPRLAIRPSDGLYVLPKPNPIGPLGSVLQSEPLEAPDGVRAWAVLYRSTGFDGQPAAVSGVILAPEDVAPAGGRPILAWAHGSRGLSDDCAPSHEGVADLMPLAQPFMDMGYVVAATDYEGLGTPGPHPFLVGASEGRAVLDIARAAGLLPGTEATTDVALLGHSQGGHAVLWASELASAYAFELQVVGTVAISPVGDLSAFASSIREQGAAEIDWLIGLQVASS
jgi:dipeptidyl aminopeptidase/acylaminoacyl peptidase